MGSGINLITFCPPEMGGVAGAWTQVMSQVGGAILLAIQAGLEAPDLHDWRTNARSFWFVFGAFAAAGASYVVFYDQPISTEEEHIKTRQRIREVEERFAQRDAGKAEKSSVA
jgi:succinate dehydrogenase/fumarate reductase flavoprotein subunit